MIAEHSKIHRPYSKVC